MEAPIAKITWVIWATGWLLAAPSTRIVMP